MNIEISIAWVVTVLLVSIRIGVLVYATPFDGVGRLPSLVLVLIVLGSAAFLVFLLRLPMINSSALSVAGIGIMAAIEVMTGLCMVVGMQAVIGACQMAGKLLDTQSGFAAAEIFNPATRDQEPLFGTLLALMAVVLFFSLDFHLWFIKGIAVSLTVIPPGSVTGLVSLPLLMKQVSAMFIFGVMLAAPVIVMLMLVDVGVGIMARTMPQMNVYFSILPLKIFLSLAVFALATRYMQPLFEHFYSSVFHYWQELMIQALHKP